MITGEQLRLVRQVKGNQPQKDVCKKLHITQAAYCKWEKRKSVNKINFERFLEAVPCSKEEFEKIIKFLLSPPPNKLTQKLYFSASFLCIFNHHAQYLEY